MNNKEAIDRQSLGDDEHRNGSEKKDQILPLREIDLENKNDIEAYFKLLTDPHNIEHFSNPPKTPEELKIMLDKEDVHSYLMENEEGKIIGGGTIEDAPPSQHDHFITKVAIMPEHQGQNYGKQLVAQLAELSFFKKTADGRDRHKLDAAIIEGVEGWNIMVSLLEGLSFNFRSRLPQQVDVFIQKEGRVRRMPTQRYELMRDDWMRVRRRKEISRYISNE